jgi:hypothetical protein
VRRTIAIGSSGLMDAAALPIAIRSNVIGQNAENRPIPNGVGGIWTSDVSPRARGRNQGRAAEEAVRPRRLRSWRR